jgi:hypothetical protein
MEASSKTAEMSRKDRKKEARELKRRRIEAAGGVRPRGKGAERDDDLQKPTNGNAPVGRSGSNYLSASTIKSFSTENPEKDTSQVVEGSSPKHGRGQDVSQRHQQQTISWGSNQKSRSSKSTSQRLGVNHRFGRVMDQPPCPDQPRFATLSIAIPGSVVSNCQTRELKTTLVGQVARAATIYHGTCVVSNSGNGEWLLV